MVMTALESAIVHGEDVVAWVPGVDGAVTVVYHPWFVERCVCVTLIHGDTLYNGIWSCSRRDRKSVV